MSDNTTNATTLANRFSETQRENRVSSIGNGARDIITGVTEPVTTVNQVALAVVMDFEEISLEKSTRELKFSERIDKAMEKTTELYASLQNPCTPWQLKLGLLRGQDALFGASRVVYGRTELSAEIAKIDGVIQRRIKRRKEAIAAKRSTGKATPAVAKQAAPKRAGKATSKGKSNPKATSAAPNVEITEPQGDVVKS